MSQREVMEIKKIVALLTVIMLAFLILLPTEADTSKLEVHFLESTRVTAPSYFVTARPWLSTADPEIIPICIQLL